MADSPIFEAASLYDALGFPVILTDANKNPGIVGDDWYNFEWNDEAFARWLRKHPDAQLALKLWPLVDIEIDAPVDDDGSFLAAALREYDELSGGVVTVAWTSRRGRHYLFEATAEQQQRLLAAECPATLHSTYLEFRLGAGKAAQSLIPPSTTDGVQRRWLNEPGEAPIASLPNKVFQYILSEALVRQEKKHQQSDAPVRSDRPGDIFNERATWREILEPHGWTHESGEEGGVQHWIRPGKTEGVSATTGYCGSDARPDCFYAFSSAPEIEPFETQTTYSKFEAYTLLMYEGDYTAASAALAKEGYVQDIDGSEFGDVDDSALGVFDAPAAPATPPPPPPPPVELGSAPDGLPDWVFDDPIGHYVLANDPHTEADRDAVYMQCYELFANFIGMPLRFHLNNTILRPNGFLMIVGNTAIGRKGTSYNDAQAPFHAFEDTSTYISERVSKGVSTGEGIVSLVADKADGMTDGRLMLFLPEFHKVLTLLRRSENILSSVLREAYEDTKLVIPTKTNPLTATQAHISMISHTTAGEFTRNASAVDFINGLFNRVCFIWVTDGKVLPNPGRVDEQVKVNLGKHLAEVRDWVHNETNGRELTWSQAANRFWVDYYVSTRVSTGDEFIDTLTARGPTHIIKHAMRQAAIEMSETIELKHLEKAIVLWDRCRDSAVRLMRFRNPDTEDRVRLLQAIIDRGGMSKTECYDLFRGGRLPTDIDSFVEFWKKEGRIGEGKKKQGGRMVAILTPKG